MNVRGKPKCQRRHHQHGDYHEDWVSDGTGGKVRETRFSDGSAITHFGGPIGNVYTDQFGEECGGPPSDGYGGQRS